MRKLLDKIAPHFEKDGKAEKLYPLYEAADTFLYSPGTVTGEPSHVRDGLDLKRMMTIVIVALVPCIYMALANTGYQAALELSASKVTLAGWRGNLVAALGQEPDPASTLSCLLLGATYFIPVYLVCMVVGGLWEALFAIVRKHEINEGFLVTGMLFPLTLPPTIPLWQVAVGISFGVVIGKEVFGGTGRNFLNPALTARAFLYFSHARHMTGNAIWNAAAPSIDGFSGATILGQVASANRDAGQEILSAFPTADFFFGWVPGSMGETSVLACLIGAAILVLSGIGSWRIMVAVLLGSLGCSALFSVINSDTNAMFLISPFQHLMVGGLMFGTVFMATDPVSAAMTNPGKWIYGILIGAMTIMIRVVNPGYPEGIMLAILFGNVFAPLIDHFFVQSNIRRRLARHGSA